MLKLKTSIRVISSKRNKSDKTGKITDKDGGEKKCTCVLTTPQHKVMPLIVTSRGYIEIILISDSDFTV